MNQFVNPLAFNLNLGGINRTSLAVGPEFLQTTLPLECRQPSLTKSQPLILWNILEISKLVPFLSPHLPHDTDSISHCLHYP